MSLPPPVSPSLSLPEEEKEERRRGVEEREGKRAQTLLSIHYLPLAVVENDFSSLPPSLLSSLPSPPSPPSLPPLPPSPWSCLQPLRLVPRALTHVQTCLNRAPQTFRESPWHGSQCLPANLQSRRGRYRLNKRPSSPPSPPISSSFLYGPSSTKGVLLFAPPLTSLLPLPPQIRTLSLAHDVVT